MAFSHLSNERILSKLDDYLNKNDYDGAERHLLYWLAEAETSGDHRTELLVRNELMGLYRKRGKKEEALACVEAALAHIEALGIAEQVGSATTYLNAATVYKAFGRAEEGIPLFERARGIYEKHLEPTDKRLGGLYNNMALALGDLSRFAEARNLFAKAIDIMQANGSDLEVAITLLNLATAAEAERGLEDAIEEIETRLEEARALLDGYENRDGYYAFVCDKCASVYGYYGHFAYENELKERVRSIYEGA